MLKYTLSVLLLSYSKAIPCKNLSQNLVGTYTPQCYTNGSWIPKQCHGSTGLCWCKTTKEKNKKPFRPWETNFSCWK